MLRCVLLLLCCCAACGPVVAPPPSPVVIVVTATPAPSPVVTVVPALVTFHGGNGPINTDPFPLAAGTYRARWAVTDPLGDCVLTVDLRSATDPTARTTVFQAHPVPGQTASNVLYNLPTGSYYLEVHSSCGQWTITLTPGP